MGGREVGVATIGRSPATDGTLERLAPGARVDSIGISIDQPCGVRDHAVLLAASLAEGGCSCPLDWLSRRGKTLAAERADVRAWAQTLTDELQRTPPDAVLLHSANNSTTPTWQRVSLKPVINVPSFSIHPPTYVPQEVVEFVRARLSNS